MIPRRHSSVSERNTAAASAKLPEYQEVSGVMAEREASSENQNLEKNREVDSANPNQPPTANNLGIKTILRRPPIKP